MYIDIADIRREAYRIWGIANHTVIYDFPKSQQYSLNGFEFKLDFSSDKESWPRLYISAYVPDKSEIRIIVPIIALKKFSSFVMYSKAWYDMSVDVFNQILKLSTEISVKRVEKTSKLKKVLKQFFKESENELDVPVEDYNYKVIYHQNTAIVSVS